MPDLKSNASIKKYFESVYPDMDFDRVYASDMKKMLKWFLTLKGNVAFTLPNASDAEADASVSDEEPLQEAALDQEASGNEASGSAEKPAI